MIYLSNYIADKQVIEMAKIDAGHENLIAFRLGVMINYDLFPFNINAATVKNFVDEVIDLFHDENYVMLFDQKFRLEFSGLSGDKKKLTIRDVDLSFDMIEIGPKFKKMVNFGRALLIYYRDEKFNAIKMGDALSSIKTSVSIKQIKFYKNNSESYCGLVAWAWISNYTLDRLKNNPLEIIHPSEWNEGRILYMKDLCINSQLTNEIYEDVLNRLFPFVDSFWVCLRAVKDQSISMVNIIKSDRRYFSNWLRG